MMEHSHDSDVRNSFMQTLATSLGAVSLVVLGTLAVLYPLVVLFVGALSVTSFLAGQRTRHRSPKMRGKVTTAPKG